MTKFEVGTEVIYTGSRICGYRGRSCMVTEIQLCRNEPVSLRIVFPGATHAYWCYATDLRHIVEWNKEVSYSPTVGGLTVRGNPGIAQRIQFDGVSDALTEMYATLHYDWGASYYHHVVTVHYESNATIVTLVIDQHRPITPETRRFRVFGGVAICNANDRFSGITGLRTALREAMDVGKRHHWDDGPKRTKIQVEEWRILRTMLKYILVDEENLQLSVDSKAKGVSFDEDIPSKDECTHG